MLAAIAGGAAGPWVTGALYDATGSYTLAFWIAIGCSALSAGAIWLAAPAAGRRRPRPSAQVGRVMIFQITGRAKVDGLLGAEEAVRLQVGRGGLALDCWRHR